MSLRIGNASGFYGDRFSAVEEMLIGGRVDVLTGDYLAELTMLILARDRQRDAGLGYARTFLRQLEGTLGLALDKGVRIVTNAGGLNPSGLASALVELGDRLALSPRVGYVTGDELPAPGALATNAYLGAFGIAACLADGADIVVTGRVSDASLVVGPAIARYGWARTDFDALAGATVAGHVLECGAQATGGNFAFFTELADVRHPGFPVAEVAADGSCVITKHPGTGGAVTVDTVTAQLVYEIGPPGYLGPDVVTHLDTVALRQDGPDRVAVSGVRGGPPPPTLKTGTNAMGGYRNAMTFVLTGLDIEAKAALVRAQLSRPGLSFTLARTDHPDADSTETASALLHVSVTDPDPARAGHAFSQAAVELALGSYPGCHLTTPPADAVPYGVFTAGTVAQHGVEHVAVLPSGARVPIAPPPVTSDPPLWTDTAEVPVPGGPTRRIPLGKVAGARSGDKGGDANVGVWTRDDAMFRWLHGFLTVDRFRALLPETGSLPVDRYVLPNLRALNFVVHGLLGAGVAASTRFDPQAKALGEWLRSRLVDVPEEVLR
jgi:hypothetical protein